MNKCDFCTYSKNKNGKIVCPFGFCILSQDEIQEILDELKEVTENE